MRRMEPGDITLHARTPKDARRTKPSDQFIKCTPDQGRLEGLLEEALRESFPASDPIAILFNDPKRPSH